MSSSEVLARKRDLGVIEEGEGEGGVAKLDQMWKVFQCFTTFKKTTSLAMTLVLEYLVNVPS